MDSEQPNEHERPAAVAHAYPQPPKGAPEANWIEEIRGAPVILEYEGPVYVDTEGRLVAPDGPVLLVQPAHYGLSLMLREYRTDGR